MNSLLPPNSTAQERVIEAATARVADVPTPLRDLWNPQTCPEPLLPWLAWALSIDSWKSYWSVSIKRARVAAALAIQRRKGTAQSVRTVVASFGGDVALREWWQQAPAGAPHTFAIAVTGGSAGDASVAQDIVDEVTRTKPVRSHFVLSQGVSAGVNPRLAASAVVGTYINLNMVAA